MADMQVVFDSHWDIACNWKVLAENLMESYHRASTHLKTLQPIMPARGTWTEGKQADYSWCTDHASAPDDPNLKVVRGGAWDYLPLLLRASWCHGAPAQTRRDNFGFRVARDFRPG